jgi:hypothetical protein
VAAMLYRWLARRLGTCIWLVRIIVVGVRRDLA